MSCKVCGKLDVSKANPDYCLDCLNKQWDIRGSINVECEVIE